MFRLAIVGDIANVTWLLVGRSTRVRSLIHILHLSFCDSIGDERFLSAVYNIYRYWILFLRKFISKTCDRVIFSHYFMIFLWEGGSYTIDQHTLEVLIYARYLRFLPVTWQRSICRRVEVYGTISKFSSIEFGMWPAPLSRLSEHSTIFDVKIFTTIFEVVAERNKL